MLIIPLLLVLFWDFFITLNISAALMIVVAPTCRARWDFNCSR